ncbi:MAG: CBS domain-containing protein [Methanobacteriaceae archaeon]
MKVQEMMDNDFVFVTKEDSIHDVSIQMEESKKFTTPVLDEKKRLVGWVTSLDITRGLRENKKIIGEIMHSKDAISTVHKDDPASLAVLDTANNKLISMPVLDKDDIVIGVVRSFDIVKTLSSLYDIKVAKIYKAMEDELKGISWDELMEASAIISRRRTGERITAEEYEHRIQKSTFGEAIWATGGLEKFFVGLIAVGELVIARKVSRARK